MTARTFCTELATISRNAALSGNRTGAAETHLEDLPITPLWPVAADVANALELASPRESKECYHVPLDGARLPDIKERDMLTTRGKSYIVVAAAEWPDISGGVPSLQIVVDEVKGT